MNKFGKRHREIFVNVPATFSKFCFQLIKQSPPRARLSPTIEVPWICWIKRRVIHPAPRSRGVPERAVAPRLAGDRAKPMIENCELLGQAAEHRQRSGSETMHDRLTLISG